jgi:hypothetical protein
VYDQSKPYRRPGDNANRSTTLSLLKKQGRPQSYVQVALSSDSGRDSESGADLFHISSPALTLLPLAFSLDDHDHLCFFGQTHNTTPRHIASKFILLSITLASIWAEPTHTQDECPDRSARSQDRLDAKLALVRPRICSWVRLGVSRSGFKSGGGDGAG